MSCPASSQVGATASDEAEARSLLTDNSGLSEQATRSWLRTTLRPVVRFRGMGSRFFKPRVMFLAAVIVGSCPVASAIGATKPVRPVCVPAAARVLDLGPKAAIYEIGHAHLVRACLRMRGARPFRLGYFEGVKTAIRGTTVAVAGSECSTGIEPCFEDLQVADVRRRRSFRVGDLAAAPKCGVPYSSTCGKVDRIVLGAPLGTVAWSAFSAGCGERRSIIAVNGKRESRTVAVGADILTSSLRASRDGGGFVWRDSSGLRRGDWMFAGPDPAPTPPDEPRCTAPPPV